jgi:hypothetical protein
MATQKNGRKQTDDPLSEDKRFFADHWSPVHHQVDGRFHGWDEGGVVESN